MNASGANLAGEDHGPEPELTGVTGDWGAEQFRNLEKSTRDGIVATDMAGRIQHANQGFQDMLGYTLDELRQMTYSQLTPPRWHAMEQSIVETRILPTGDSREYEKEYYRKDGTIVPISIRVWVSRDRDGRPTAMFGIVRDITERKRAEAVKAQLAAIVENSDDAILSVDLDGIVQTWNDGAVHLYGYTADEMIGRTLAALMPPDIVQREFALLADVAQGKAVRHYDTVRLRKDGSEVPISLSISPIRDLHGNVIGASKMARDISERRRAEEAERRADRQKDQFLAMLSHELRNPLAAISVAGELLSRTSGKEPATQAALAMLRRQTVQLTRIVDDLLDVTRIAQGRIVLRKEPVDVATVLDESAESIRSFGEQTGHRILITHPYRPLYVLADRARLIQCIGNVLHNAVKYSDPRSPIEVRVGEQNGHVTIEVRDRGAGIAPDLLPHVFELFVQSDRTLDRSEGGLGIGLSVVRQLVEMHGGRVRVHSDGVGRGSTFTLELPRTAPPPKAIPPEPERAPRLRVLVVDDNRDAADGLAMLLRLDGHEVRAIYRGDLVIDTVHADDPDCVLLDIGLPGVDGYEIARQLRAIKDGRHRTLVAITGYGQGSDISAAYEAGFDAHAVKPADPAALNAILARHCRVHRAEAGGTPSPAAAT